MIMMCVGVIFSVFCATVGISKLLTLRTKVRTYTYIRSQEPLCKIPPGDGRRATLLVLFGAARNATRCLVVW